MNGLSCFAFLAVVVLATKIRAECFDWDASLKSIKDDCKACQEKHKKVEDIKDCFFKPEDYTEKDGKVKTDKFIELALEDFKGDAKTKEAIANGMRECLKTDPHTSAESIKVGDCIHDCIKKHCPEAAAKLTTESEEVNRCFEDKGRMRTRRALPPFV